MEINVIMILLYLLKEPNNVAQKPKKPDTANIPNVTAHMNQVNIYLFQWFLPVLFNGLNSDGGLYLVLLIFGSSGFNADIKKSV